MSINRLHRLLSAFHFFNELILIYPIYTLMFADAGLSGKQISIVVGVYSVTTVLVEIPSGILADRLKRNKLIVVSQIFKMVGMALWAVFPGFVGFSAGFLVWAIGVALRSGTIDAYLFDALSHAKRSDEYEKLRGRIGMWSFLGMIGASVGATLFSSHSYEWMLLVSIVSVAISLMIGLFLPHVPRTSTNDNQDPGFAWADWRNALQTAFKSPSLRIIFVIATAVAGFAWTFDDYYTLVLDQLQIVPREWIALVFGVAMGANALAKVIAYKFKSESLWRPALMLLISGVAVAATGWFSAWVAIVCIVIASMALTIMGVLHSGMIQRMVTSEVRSTVGSLQAVGAEVGFLPGVALVGGVVDTRGYAMAFSVLGGVVVLMGVGYLMYSATKPRIH